MPDRSGQQIEKYHLHHLLGTGSFADVYLAEHIFLRTPVALKLSHPWLLSDGKTRQQIIDLFLNEAQLVAQLRHPHIIRVQDFGIMPDETGLYIVMEYAPHGNLRDLHPLGTTVPLSTIVSYVNQIAEALHHAHSHKQIHRDIKPENMLLDEQRHVALGDFGIATIAHSTSSLQTQGSAGTVYYMAPEQIKGQPRPSSDQYALAITVYEWLTGKRPFDGSMPIEIAMRHLTEPPPLFDKSIRTPVADVVLKALAKDPKDRYEDILAFASALQEASKQEKTAQQWLNEGYVHHDAKQYEQAIIDYTQAIILNPNYNSVFYRRGIAYHNLKQYEQAISDYTQAVNQNPHYSAAYYGRAVTHETLNHYQEAVSDYTQAINLSPHYTFAHYGRGLAHYYLSNYQKAISDYTQAIKLDSNYANAYYGRSLAHKALNHEQQAKEDYDRAIALGYRP